MRNIFSKIEWDTTYSQKRMLSELSKNIDNHIWLVCAPKSGSTWLTRILQDVLQWKTIKMVPSFGNREQEIDLTCLLREGAKGNILTPHQHCRYSTYTRDIVNALDTRIVLQVRNIFDTVFSFYDHIEIEGPTFPSGFMNERSWERMSKEQRFSYLVDLVIPWYFNFYCGWVNSDLFKDGKIQLITYEDLKEDTVKTVNNVLSFCAENISDDNIIEVLDAHKRKKKNTRQNKGVVGRGSDLPDSLKDRIYCFASYYTDIDFGPIGL